MSFLANSKASILMTGGTTAIGLSLATKLVEAGHEVIVNSRYPEKLEAAKQKCSKLITVPGTISTEDGRKELFQNITTNYPQVNVLINNAGASRVPAPLQQTSQTEWVSDMEVLNKTLTARMHLATLFAPHFKQKEHALFVNVTSIAALYPVDWAPIYSAAQAGVHSFTLSLRHQMKELAPHIEVIEVQPPAVETAHGPEWMKGVGNLPPDVYAQSVVSQLVQGKEEIGYQA